jgi:hypothetical protein
MLQQDVPGFYDAIGWAHFAKKVPGKVNKHIQYPG